MLDTARLDAGADVEAWPELFARGLARAKSYLDRLGEQPKILTINAWNEWTEGSYLEPDTVHGMSYLNAIRNVFRS